jgi:hypothetical protein
MLNRIFKPVVALAAMGALFGVIPNVILAENYFTQIVAPLLANAQGGGPPTGDPSYQYPDPKPAYESPQPASESPDSQ